MSSKVYLVDSASILESKIMKLGLTSNYNKANYVVNPKSIGTVGKEIIINLPLKLDFNRLSRFNHIISRFPIDCDNYELIPYDEGIIDLELELLEGRYILSKDLLSTLDFTDILLGSKFVYGLEPETEGYLNLVGYLMNSYKSKTKLKNS